MSTTPPVITLMLSKDALVDILACIGWTGTLSEGSADPEGIAANEAACRSFNALVAALGTETFGTLVDGLSARMEAAELDELCGPDAPIVPIAPTP